VTRSVGYGYLDDLAAFAAEAGALRERLCAWRDGRKLPEKLLQGSWFGPWENWALSEPCPGWPQTGGVHGYASRASLYRPGAVAVDRGGRCANPVQRKPDAYFGLLNVLLVRSRYQRDKTMHTQTDDDEKFMPTGAVQETVRRLLEDVDRASSERRSDFPASGLFRTAPILEAVGAGCVGKGQGESCAAPRSQRRQSVLVAREPRECRAEKARASRRR